MIGREDEVRGYREKVKYLYVIIFLAFAAIGTKLFFLQILKGEELRKYSDGNRLKKERLQASRGIIYDRNGKVIVDNRASFDVVLLSQYYTPSPRTDKRLAYSLGVQTEDLEKRIEKLADTPVFYPLLLKADVTKDVIAAIEMDADGFKGIDIEANVQRRYPHGEVAAQLLGYIGEVDKKDMKERKLERGEFIGKMGIERNYDKDLRGVNGIGYVEVDAMGRRRKSEGGERLLGFVTQTDPIPGNNIYLTLDLDLELAAAQALKSRGFNGSIVAIDPRNGEILAMVNYPSYQPQLISGREINPKVWAELVEDLDRPLRNRAIQDHYPPGSTFKLMLAMAGLAEGLVTPKSTVNCGGSLQFGKRRFACWKTHGTIDFERAIKESCDVFFYKLGLQLGVDRISKYARLFGFGARTGIPLVGEQKGNIPDTKWKLERYHEPWQDGETLSVSIGQGFVDVTPLQLANAYASLGNGGFVYKPFLVKEIRDRKGNVLKEYPPELVRKIDIPSEVFDRVKEGLFRVVNEPGGTAYSSRSKLTQISGKTGTAQVKAFTDMKSVKCAALPRNDRHHGWFVGYAPKDNPQIAVAAIAEHSCHGTAAAPVVRDVIETYFIKQAANNLSEGKVDSGLNQTVPPSPKPEGTLDPKVKEQTSEEEEDE